ncbi:MAG: branched-chain amino acid transporter permease [Oscillospiraceae bacterium]|nr:branched-chain amino acid transporter permease [Oscillospiraceae bacterium]
MTAFEALITIGVIALGTLLTRFLPFFLFPPSRPLPKWVAYLGRVLAPAVMAMLVVYCLRQTSLLSYPFGLPEAISLAAVAALHLWRHNTLLSIGAGTVLYMVLVQLVF